MIANFISCLCATHFKIGNDIKDNNLFLIVCGN